MGKDTPFDEPFYDSTFEKCVNCGTETPYTINTHIDFRDYYIEGLGQLCKECYKKIYDEYESNSIRT
jgi:hypothetical protein